MQTKIKLKLVTQKSALANTASLVFDGFRDDMKQEKINKSRDCGSNNFKLHCWLRGPDRTFDDFRVSKFTDLGNV